MDESNWTAWQHALYAGHIDTAELLRLPAAPAAAASAAAAPPAAGPAAGEGAAPFMDVDDIPSLLLPPPIIPTRTMGHNYLQNRVHIQLKLGIPGRAPAIRLVYVKCPWAGK